MKKLFDLITANKPDEIKKQLTGSKLDRDINELSVEGASPLIFSIVNDRDEIAEILLNFGADPNLGRIDNNDALYYAITSKKYYLVRSLVGSGADLDFEYSNGKTALDYMEFEDDEKLEAAILGEAFDIDEAKELALDAFSLDQSSGFIDLDNVDFILETKVSGKKLPEDEKELKALIFSGDDPSRKGIINDKRKKETKSESHFNFGLNVFENESKDKGEINNCINKDTKVSLGNGKKRKAGVPDWDLIAEDDISKPTHLKGELINKISNKSTPTHMKGELTNKICSNADLVAQKTKSSSHKFMIPRGKLSEKKVDQFADALINYKNEKGQNGLMIAAQSGNLDIIRKLISNGAEVNTLDFQGNPVLSYAVLGKNHNAIKYLVERGARINQKNNQGFTPLFYALKAKDHVIFELLLKNNANTKMKYNGSPLIVIATRKKMYEYVELLIKYEADPRSRDNKYNKALDYAQRKNDTKLVRILTEAEKKLLERSQRKTRKRKTAA